MDNKLDTKEEILELCYEHDLIDDGSDGVSLNAILHHYGTLLREHGEEPWQTPWPQGLDWIARVPREVWVRLYRAQAGMDWLTEGENE